MKLILGLITEWPSSRYSLLGVLISFLQDPLFSSTTNESSVPGVQFNNMSSKAYGELPINLKLTATPCTSALRRYIQYLQ